MEERAEGVIGIEMGKRIDKEVNNLPEETRDVVRTELAQASATGEYETPIRKMLPGEEPAEDEWYCSGKSWAVDQIKAGAMQKCPQENLQFVRYSLGFDQKQMFCPRCAEYMIAHPDDKYLEDFDIPPEIPKLGWRPDPIPKGWEP